ncbi:MAG: pentapeptide repeat-containing protein [Terracidiphilus sp.]
MNRLRRIVARLVQRLRARAPSSLWKRAGSVLLLAALLAALLATALFLPEWLAHRAVEHAAALNPADKIKPAEFSNLENESRRTVLQVLGGLFAFVALVFTWRRVRVSEQGHITDRYTKAIEQLGALTAAGKANVEVRLGAIYALERIAQDSPRDHWTIMEVLTAYVRQNAPWPEQEPTPEENKKAIARGPATEIQAILTVLGRRRRDGGRERDGHRLDLHGSDLRGANLDRAHMEGADFTEAHVEGARFIEAHVERADFSGAHVEGANFREAHVEGANFTEAHVEGASFTGAHVERAYFFEAHVERAYFSEAHVERANFSGAHVEGAYFTGAHVEGAFFDGAHVEGAHFIMAHVDGANFNGAHVEGADFRLAEGLAVERIQKAEGWEKAVFDGEFARMLNPAEGTGAMPPEVRPEPEPSADEPQPGGGGDGEETEPPIPPAAP